MKFTNLFLCTPMQNPNNFDPGEKTISQYPVRIHKIIDVIDFINDFVSNILEG